MSRNICVLVTPHDAHMRDFRVTVPRDCIASNTAEDNAFALDQLARVRDATVCDAAEVELPTE